MTKHILLTTAYATDQEPSNSLGELKMINNREWDDFVSSFCKSIGISVPATVTPFSVPGEPTAKDSGEYQVSSCDNENDCVKFTITKKMDINIPMLFGAEICFDKAYAVDNGKCNDEDKEICQ